MAALLVINTLMPAATANGEINRSSEIIAWEQLTAPKGFVLSNYLYNEQKCSLIWEKQLPEFQKKNPQVEDPDLIAEGVEITVQRCAPREELNIAQDSGELTAEDAKVSENEKNIKQNSKNIKRQEEDLDWDGNPPYLNLYGGFITENESDKVDGAYGIGVSGDILKFLGYDLRALGGAGAIFLQNEVIFKTAPGNTRGQLIVGFGNRIGLENRDLDRLNKGVDSYTYAGIGVEMTPHPRYRVQFDLTGNFSKNISPNFGAAAQKKFGDDFWIGVFGEVQSSQSAADDGDKDRKYYTGGLKLSF